MNYITEINRRRTFAIITYMASVLVLSITGCAHQKNIASLSYIDRKHVNPVEVLSLSAFPIITDSVTQTFAEAQAQPAGIIESASTADLKYKYSQKHINDLSPTVLNVIDINTYPYQFSIADTIVKVEDESPVMHLGAQTSLVLGIISVLCFMVSLLTIYIGYAFFVFAALSILSGIAALILGNKALKDIKSHPEELIGIKKANWARVLGILSIVLASGFTLAILLIGFSLGNIEFSLFGS